VSTRCCIHFEQEGKAYAKVYRHSDGYPEGILPDLERFFKDVEAQTKDTRFNDPTYLAAKFVVWQADEYTRDKNHPLDFLSVGVVLEGPGDIEYRYHVVSGGWDATDRPTVTWEETR
jgi:hypothetical protein